MAYTANTAFEARITNGRVDDLANITGKYSDGTDYVDCSAGFLCKKGEQLDCEGFTGVKNENSYQMLAAEASDLAGTPIYACNTYDNQLLSDGNGYPYFVGHKTLGLGVPAGRYGTFTRIHFDGESSYRFGIGNVSGDLGTNEYLTIADGLLVPAASAPTANGSVYFAVKGTGNFIEGTTDAFEYVDVVAYTVYA